MNMRLRDRIKAWWHKQLDKPSEPPAERFVESGEELHGPAKQPEWWNVSDPFWNQPKEPRMGKFEVFKDRAGQFRWRLRARNGRVVAQSEAYSREGDAKRSCKAVQTAANGARVVE